MESLVVDTLVVGAGVSALAAAARLRVLGRSLVLVETYGERPVRTMRSIDPNALFAESLSGDAFESHILHTPEPHAMRRIFIDAADIRIEEGRVICEDSEVRVSAANVLVALAPGAITYPNRPGVVALCGRGVSQCALSDAPYLGSPVIVLGEADFAYESALFLADARREVLLFARHAPTVRRALLRSAVEASPLVAVESGVELVSVENAREEPLRLRVTVLHGSREVTHEAGGVIVAGALRYDDASLAFAARMLTGLPESCVSLAGGLGGVDENDHAALVKDALRAGTSPTCPPASRCASPRRGR